ncbi:MAG: polysaccharide biosynthesis/export family protein [Bradyrhizobium sp.]
MRNLAGVIRFVFVLAAVLLLPACAQNGQSAFSAKPDDANSALALAKSETVAADYQIASRDILEVSVFQVPDLNKTVQVSDDGNIFLPLIGKVAVRDKTTHEAGEIIATKLKKRYLQSPQVSVFVKQYGQRVTISGEVKTPRVLSVDGQINLTQAIASAGGFGELANSNRVHIARTLNQHIHDAVYDVDAIQDGSHPDPVLRGGDLVVVEKSGAKVALKNIKDLLPFAILAPLM